MTLATYTRRLTPEFDPGWFDAEHAAIQRAMRALDDVAIENVTAPLSYDPTTRTLSTSGGTFTAQRSSAVTNATTSFASAGLIVPVVSGQSYALHYVVFLSNNFFPTQPAKLQVVYPSMSFIGAGVLGATTSAAAPVILSATGAGSPLALGVNWVGFTATSIAFTINIVLRGVSASGNVDLQFAAAGSTPTITIGDGSCVVATVL